MRYRLPPLNTLRIFEAVMRHGSIRQAAGELCLTPQAVSLQLKQLESHLAQQLFQRSARSLTPTLAARQFYKHVRDGLECFAEGIQTIAPPSKQQLYLYVSPYFATEFLVPRLGRFTSSVPDIDVRMAIGVELDEFNNKGLEAAIHWSYGAPPPDFVETPLIDDLKVLVATPSLLKQLPIHDPHDLLKHSIVAPLVANSLWQDTLDLLGVTQRPSHQSIMMLHTHAAMMEAVLAGLGVGFISYADAMRSVNAGRLVAPFGMDLLKQLPIERIPRFSLLARPDRRHSPILMQFTRWLLDEVCTEEVAGYTSTCRPDQQTMHTDLKS